MRVEESASSLLTESRALTRRQWLTLWTASFGLAAMTRVFARARQLPPGVGMAAPPPCDPSTKPTPARTPSGYRANAPMRTQLAEATERGTALLLTGAVIGLRCGYIADAVVEIWQADAAGVMDAAGNRLRGRQRTDAQGGYRVETIVPGAAAGQAPRVNLRLTVPGKATLSTTMFLPDAVAGAANAKDKSFDPLLAMTLINRDAKRVTASFNVILDL